MMADFIIFLFATAFVVGLAALVIRIAVGITWFVISTLRSEANAQIGGALTNLLCHRLDHEQIADAHHRIVARQRVLDGAIDFAKLGHVGHRHSVFQSIAALAWPDDNHRERAGWRLLRRDLYRALAGACA